MDITLEMDKKNIVHVELPDFMKGQPSPEDRALMNTSLFSA